MNALRNFSQGHDNPRDDNPVMGDVLANGLTDAPDARFLSREACAALLQRARGFATGGGSTTLYMESRWVGNIRWARNRIITSGDVRDNAINVTRNLRGAESLSSTNRIDDAHIASSVRHAERFLGLQKQYPEADLAEQFIEPYPEPKIWSDGTYKQTAAERAELMHRLVAPAIKAGMVSAGYAQVSAHGRASVNNDRIWYYPYTMAQYSVTVRDPAGTASGWAGIDGNDWEKLDAEAVSAVALDKCLRSRNPVRAEPGRYTVILEPQAVCDLVEKMFTADALDRETAEDGAPGPPAMRRGSIYSHGNGFSKIGERIIDERLSVSVDSMDPELGFPPFLGWSVFHPSTWIKNGVLTDLVYGRAYAVKRLGLNTGGRLTRGSFRMSGSGPATTMDEMIATTKRGIIVTRFSDVRLIDEASMLLTGYTRDGTWLIENGKISKAVKNFRFTESPVFVLNNVEQVGTSRRVFHPGSNSLLGYEPVIVPALKVRDFSFTSLSDAV